MKLDARKGRVARGNSKHKILDAAEMLFARRGYYGVSVREITRQAGVQLALASYHFGTKEEMFRQVVARRADEHADNLEQSLKKALAEAGDQPPAVDRILRAFLAPIIERAISGDAGWKHYVQVLAWAMNMRDNADFIRPLQERWIPIIRQYVAALHGIYPKATIEDINWAFYFLESSLVHILVESGIVDMHSDGLCRSSDLATILDRMVPFYTTAFERFA